MKPHNEDDLKEYKLLGQFMKYNVYDLEVFEGHHS